MPVCFVVASEYRISYLLTTYNKLPYLRHILERLVAARQPDEEIVVADGGSTDGTGAYLQQLFDAGQIQQLITERDKGEAHGFNKCLFAARGEFVKIITDDDAFHYPTIRAAVGFMQQYPAVDVVVGYNAAIWLEDLTQVQVKEDAAKDFKLWYEQKTPFQMIGLSLLLRRASLTLTGVFNTGVVMVDLDFMYRISSLKVNIAWCNAVLSAHVSNPNGNFNRMTQQSRDEEYNRIVNFYASPVRRSLGSSLAGVLEQAKRPLRPVKRALFDRLKLPQYQNPELFPSGYVPVPGESPQDAVYRVCDEFLAAHNARMPATFIHKAESIDKVMKTQ